MKLDPISFSKEELLAKVDDTLTNIVKKEGYITYEVNRKPISTNGGNYLAELNEIEIKGTTKDGFKEIHLFLKSMIPETKLDVVNLANAYEMEIYTYSNLFKVFNEVQNEYGIPKEERYATVKYYGACDGKAIIFENISKKDYCTLYRMDTVPLKFAELSVKNLAKFHALSFVLEKKKPQFWKTRDVKLNKSPYIFGKSMMELKDTSINHALMIAKEDALKKLKKYNERIYDKFYKYCTEPTLVSTLCHGDYRPNNILVKQKNGENLKVLAVDYQMLHYGCPMNDLLYFLFSGTDQEFRKKYLDYLKELYYDTMTSFLKYFNIDVQVVYPRWIFDKYYKERLDYGFIVSIFLTPFLFVLENDVPDFTSGPIRETLNDLKLDDKFEERITGLIDDFIQWGYL